MNLDLALIEQNRRHWIVVLRVNRRDLFINRRLTHSRYTQHTTNNNHATGTACEPSRDMILKHRPHLSRWTRQKHDRCTMMIDEHPRRSAVWIRQHLCILDHHRLARIALRHSDSKTLKTLPDLRQHNLVQQQPATECTCSDLTCDIVFGWTKTSSSDHHFRSANSVFDCFFQAGVVVADDRFEFYFDTEAVEFFSQPETVGVSAIGRE